MDLELTPFGEALLSAGKFKPVYYAFFDDDVLYDASGSMDVIENQNDIEPRIQTNTPKSKTQYSFSGIETNVSRYIEVVRTYRDDPDYIEPMAQVGILGEDDYWTYPPVIDNKFSFTEPIGTMEIGSEHAPSWNVRVLDGELSGAVNYLTSSTTTGKHNNVRRIPQLDFDLNYSVIVGSTEVVDITGPISDRIISPIYDDGTFLYLSEDRPQLIFAIDEDNADIDTEYDVEVFEVLPPPSSKDPVELRTLYFQRRAQQVVDNILLDEPEVVPYTKLTPSYAEYFFQVNVDLEIPEEEICPKISHLASRGIQIDDIPYTCPDVQGVGKFDLYRTNVTEDDVEDCDE